MRGVKVYDKQCRLLLVPLAGFRTVIVHMRFIAAVRREAALLGASHATIVTRAYAQYGAAKAS